MLLGRRICKRSSAATLAIIGLVTLGVSQVSAGMPVVLREDIETVLQLKEEPHQRLQAISFFLLGLLLSTLAVRFLWNVLAKEFTNLPKLSFVKAAALVTLWGLLFIVVLTMISGARELMTPGAWKKEGMTYTLAEEPEESNEKRVEERGEDRSKPVKPLTPIERKQEAPEKGESP